MSRSVLFACDIDSQVYGALPLARAFRERGWEVVFAIDALAALPAALAVSLQTEFETCETPLPRIPTEDWAMRHQAVGVFTTGSGLDRFRKDFRLVSRSRGETGPALFCGFNGVVLDKFEEGLAWRLGYDVICLNGPRDLAMFEAAVMGGDFSGQPVVLTGLHRRGAPAPERRLSERRLFVFAEQVIIPNTIRERSYLFSRLIHLATANPDWDVVVKPRIQSGERTFHRPILHPEAFFGPLAAAPDNLSISHEPLGDLLSRASLLGTVSSTALFDAITAGVPAFGVADFGIRTEYGTHVFMASGLLADTMRTDDLGRLSELRPKREWLAWVGYEDSHSPNDLVDWLEAASSETFGANRGFYDDSTVPSFRERFGGEHTLTLERLRSEGQEALRGGRHDEAVAAFELASAEAPNSTNLMRLLAEAYIQAGRSDDALRMLRSAAVLQPQNRNLRRRLRMLEATWLGPLAAWSARRFGRGYRGRGD